MANRKKCGCCDQGAYAIFKINAAEAAWGSIRGDINKQEDVMALFDECFSTENMKTSGNIKITIDEDGNYDISTETFEQEQEEPSDTWVVKHNLGKYPNVITVDSSGRQFMADVIYDSLDQVTILINGAIKGKVYLN